MAHGRAAVVAVMAMLLTACSAAPAASRPPVTAAAPRTTATDAAIAEAQARLRTNPRDVTSLDVLAAAYLQKVRDLGDPSYYPKAEVLLTSALREKPADVEAMVLMGSLGLGRHQFAAALEWGQKARALAPRNARALASWATPR